MNKIRPILYFLAFAAVIIPAVVKSRQLSVPEITASPVPEPPAETVSAEIQAPEPVKHDMNLDVLRASEYPGSGFTVTRSLKDGSNFRRQIVSYESEGIRIYGLLTIPFSERPEGGYPAILFMHGYIPPKEYSTTGNYPTYQARLARSGFVTFKPDLRGHGNSGGEPVNTHFSEKYVIDSLYALSSLKLTDGVDADRIGYWGHSNGGSIGLRHIVVNSDLKAASFWAGVVGSQEDQLETHNAKIPFLRNPGQRELVLSYGLPSGNPGFWKTIDPYFHLQYIETPVQLQHGTGDLSVPVELSRHLYEKLKSLDKTVEYFEYEGDNHILSGNVNLAFERTIAFFRKYL